VRTLYACLGENDGELSFEPNQIITNGKYLLSTIYLALPEFIKNVSSNISSFKIKFQSLPFFTWAAP